MKKDPSINGLRFAGNVLVALFHAAMFFDPLAARGCPVPLAYAVIFAGSCAVPIVAWHALNRVSPRALALFEGRTT